MHNVFFPAPKAKTSSAVVLASGAAGVILGGLAMLAITSFAAPTTQPGKTGEWRRARDWAKMDGVSPERAAALLDLDHSLADPEISIIEFMPTLGTKGAPGGTVAIKFYEGSQGNAAARIVAYQVDSDMDANRLELFVYSARLGGYSPETYKEPAMTPKRARRGPVW